ncbi:hypothetical protein [Pseudoruegeria sp. SK021]|uniref:hypothetical protein n=1 Tax=Pseudoruegeria sp. SK021 TaxID=1933035 RepID=UPI000A25AB48|nr:hypothetical protein [Pseudoruegeria sp. SK021]OSP53724.1 hypothetical protein BV911_16415 [Pseudoruegeria sp. SK021]
MPACFSLTAFERLLFPLHRSIYAGIEKNLRLMEAVQPGLLAGASKFARVTNALGTQDAIDPASLAGMTLPAYDLRVIIAADGSQPLRRVLNHQIEILPHHDRPFSRYSGCHLIVVTASETSQAGYIVPLGYVLHGLGDIVLRKDGYQIYQHHLYPSSAPMPFTPISLDADPGLPWSTYAGTGLVYTGLTSRDWATRLKEHQRAARSGSGTLFHHALRDHFFPIVKTEHEILRVGLTRAEAMRLEEIEIEAKSLFPIHNRGLNMIPGGEAGMRFISKWRKTDGSLPDPGRVEEAYDDALSEMLNARRADCAPDGSAIARLWAENLSYRIGVTCGRSDRLSQLQITFARIWDACGWPQEKIALNLDGVDRRRATLSQVRDLLAGRTYAEIPNLLPNRQS